MDQVNSPPKFNSSKMFGTHRVMTPDKTQIGEVVELCAFPSPAVPVTPAIDPVETYSIVLCKPVLLPGSLHRVVEFFKNASMKTIIFELRLLVRPSIFSQLPDLVENRDFDVFVDLGPADKPFGEGIAAVSVLQPSASIVLVAVSVARLSALLEDGETKPESALMMKVCVLFRIPQEFRFAFDAVYVPQAPGLSQKSVLHFGYLSFWRPILPGDEDP
jgi:hypothetical protein